MSVEYTIHLREVAKIEVISLNTDLTAGSPAEPFAVIGYDKEGHEFDTLDGLQISWYLGSKRTIAYYEKSQQKGPVTKVLPIGAGKGSVIAILTDTNYQQVVDETYKQVVDPAVKAISVTAPLSFEPEELILLVHGQAPIKVIFLSLGIVRLPRLSLRLQSL